MSIKHKKNQLTCIPLTTLLKLVSYEMKELLNNFNIIIVNLKNNGNIGSNMQSYEKYGILFIINCVKPLFLFLTKITIILKI